MSFWAGSAPTPQAPSAAAPPPVTPSTVKNRLRFIPSPMGPPGAGLVVAYSAIAGHLVLEVAIDAPPHRERRHLVNLRHFGHVAVARTAGVGAECFDVSHVREVCESGEGVNPDPLRRLLVSPSVADLLDLGLVRWRRPADHQMTAETGLDRRNPRFARHGHRSMAVQARDPELAGMDVMAKKNRLAG